MKNNFVHDFNKPKNALKKENVFFKNNNKNQIFSESNKRTIYREF